MISWRAKATVGGAAFLLLWVLGHLTGFFPFKPTIVRWSLQEDYRQGKIPQGSRIQQSHSARTREGLLIGVDGPGFVEWYFQRSGPFPTVIQPFFVPGDKQDGQVVIVTPHHPEPRVLFHNLPLRYRPFDITPWIKNEEAFALRFEGTGARLKGIRFYEPSSLPSIPWAVLGVTVFLALFAAYRKKGTALLILGVGVLAFFLRWQTFRTYFSLPLEGDAISYWFLAQNFDWHHVFRTGPREPGFIWVVRAARFAFGDSIRSVRFLGVLISSLWSYLTVELACAAGWPIGLGIAAGILVATNPFAIFMSVQGYQLELFTFLILLFAIAWHRKNASAMGWIGGFLCVTRVQAVAAVLPLVWLCGWRSAWNKREWGRFAIPFLILMLPYLFAVRSETGSVLGHLNPHAHFYENMEATQAGTALPSAEASGLVPLMVGRGQFLHRMTALVEGYARLLFDPRDPYNRILLNSHYARAWNLFFLPFFWVGLFGMLWEHRTRMFLWVPFLFLGVLPMLHDLIREPRLLFHIEPFAALIVVWGAAKLARRENKSRFSNPQFSPDE